MNALKTMYESLPETISIPREYIHRKGEVIIILEDEPVESAGRSLERYFGSIPDFPERSSQGNYDTRESF